MVDQRRELAGCTATGLLKVLALVFMMCDHAGKMLLPGVMEMRMIGRIAFPLYCWCLVVGACRTRSMGKYLLRMLVIGAVSQPLYMWGLNHTWQEPNIFLTLAVALAGLWGIREKKWGSHIWAPAVALVLAVVLRCDYGWKGVALVFLLYACRGSRSALAAVMVAFCMFWGASSASVVSFFGLRLDVPAPFSALAAPFLRLQALAIFALPLMLMPSRWDLRMPRWVGYALYPAHLVVLIVLEQMF